MAGYYAARDYQRSMERRLPELAAEHRTTVQALEKLVRALS